MPNFLPEIFTNPKNLQPKTKKALLRQLVYPFLHLSFSRPQKLSCPSCSNIAGQENFEIVKIGDHYSDAQDSRHIRMPKTFSFDWTQVCVKNRLEPWPKISGFSRRSANAPVTCCARPLEVKMRGKERVR